MARVDHLKNQLEQARKKLIELSSIPKDSIDIYPQLVQELILAEYDRLEDRIIYLEDEIRRYDLKRYSEEELKEQEEFLNIGNGK